MKRALLTTLALVAITIPLVATSGAHFFSAVASVNDFGQLSVVSDEAGVGQQQVNYTLTATATYDWGCINGGSNHPQATNKETTSGGVQGGGNFTPQNGRVTATVVAPTDAPTPPSNFCPSGQTLVLAKATYTDALLTDTTNGDSIEPTGTFSRVFFTFRK